MRYVVNDPQIQQPLRIDHQLNQQKVQNCAYLVLMSILVKPYIKVVQTLFKLHFLNFTLFLEQNRASFNLADPSLLL